MSNDVNINTLGGGRTALLLLRRRMMMQEKGLEVNWNQYFNRIGMRNMNYSATFKGEIIDDGHYKLYGTRQGSENNPFFFFPSMPGNTNLRYARLIGKFDAVTGVFYEGSEVIMKRGISTIYVYPKLSFFEVGVEYDERFSLIYMDLTQMFGAGNEPPTIAQFESWLQENGINPNEYIPYNAGETRIMTKPSWL